MCDSGVKFFMVTQIQKGLSIQKKKKKEREKEKARKPASKQEIDI